MVHALQALNRGIQRVENWIAIGLMAASALITILQVVTRYGFNHPLTWPEELCTLLLVWMTFFGASLLLKKEQHIEIDFFTKLMPRRAQQVIGLINVVLIFAFLTVVGLGRLQAAVLPVAAHLGGAGDPQELFLAAGPDQRRVDVPLPRAGLPAPGDRARRARNRTRRINSPWPSPSCASRSSS